MDRAVQNEPPHKPISQTMEACFPDAAPATLAASPPDDAARCCCARVAPLGERCDRLRATLEEQVCSNWCPYHERLQCEAVARYHGITDTGPTVCNAMRTKLLLLLGVGAVSAHFASPGELKTYLSCTPDCSTCGPALTLTVHVRDRMLAVRETLRRSATERQLVQDAFFTFTQDNDVKAGHQAFIALETRTIAAVSLCVTFFTNALDKQRRDAAAREQLFSDISGVSGPSGAGGATASLGMPTLLPCTKRNECVRLCGHGGRCLIGSERGETSRAQLQALRKLCGKRIRDITRLIRDYGRGDDDVMGLLLHTTYWVRTSRWSLFSRVEGEANNTVLILNLGNDLFAASVMQEATIAEHIMMPIVFGESDNDVERMLNDVLPADLSCAGFAVAVLGNRVLVSTSPMALLLQLTDAAQWQYRLSGDYFTATVDGHVMDVQMTPEAARAVCATKHPALVRGPLGDGVATTDAPPGGEGWTYGDGVRLLCSGGPFATPEDLTATLSHTLRALAKDVPAEGGLGSKVLIGLVRTSAMGKKESDLRSIDLNLYASPYKYIAPLTFLEGRVTGDGLLSIGTAMATCCLEDASDLRNILPLVCRHEEFFLEAPRVMFFPFMSSRLTPDQIDAAVNQRLGLRCGGCSRPSCKHCYA